MTVETSVDVREVIFINERCRVDYEDLPPAVGESADQALTTLQNNEALTRKMFKELSENLNGVDEIRLPYASNTYRVYVYRGCAWVIMVLDAGIKKSPSGHEIPGWQVERLEQRLRKAKDYCADNEAELKRAFDSRATRRAKILESEDEAGRLAQ
jgi:hypothetical protein